MFSWVNKEQGGRNKEGDMFQTVTEGLQSLYTKKLLPLEEAYFFHDFHSPALEEADFQSKPMVLLVGQYSTGKTTFIRYPHRPPFVVCKQDVTLPDSCFFLKTNNKNKQTDKKQTSCSTFPGCLRTVNILRGEASKCHLTVTSQ